jgi:pimeloyl-ACP methyl ester carboxylesterase
MKKVLFLLALALSTVCFGQTNKQRVFLFVHGAWGGGWEYRKVDSLLRAKGDIVFHPTLTGLGERVHLANPEINLTTHITDIVNAVKFENLYDVILVGHSYGGMVITGVAEQIPDRIQRLIYLDAFVPNNGESMKTQSGPLWDNLLSPLIKDGLIGYPFGPTKPNPPTDVPQPLKTFTETIQISNPLVKKIPTTYILMTKDGKGGFEQAVSRARDRGWKIITLEGGHYPMRDQPEALVKKLKMILE